MPRSEARTRRERNKHFNLWLSETVYNRFVDYLQHYSYGENLTEMFTIFLLELFKLDDEKINFVNVRTAIEREHKQLLSDKYGNVTDQDLICLRNVHREKLDQDQRALSCENCRLREKALFKACQEIRADFKSAPQQGDKKWIQNPNPNKTPSYSRLRQKRRKSKPP